MILSHELGQELMDESASMIIIKTNPSSSKANPQMEQVHVFATCIYQHAHLLGGTQVSRNHG